MSSSRVLPTGDPSILGFIPERFEPLHRRIQRDTIVRVYSLTKIVVSVAALTLLEEGKIGIARSSGGIPSGVSGPSRACWWNISRPAIGSCEPLTI
jgi:hypothetical protein